MKASDKKCSICGEAGGKNNCGFRKRSDAKDRFRKNCKYCCSVSEKICYQNKIDKYRRVRKLYYRKNADKITARIREDRRKDPEKHHEIDRKKYQKDPEKYRARGIKNYYKNSEKINARSKKYFKVNSEKISMERKIDRKINPEKYARYNKNKYEKEKKNPKAMLNRRMHSSVYSSLKNNKNGKSWKLLVEYSVEKLKKHLNKTMPNGYNWQSFLDGKLHIDHIIPISVFNFTKPEHEDFKRCWTLKNLQLLPAKENISKGCKLEKPFQPSLLL